MMATRISIHQLQRELDTRMSILARRSDTAMLLQLNINNSNHTNHAATFAAWYESCSAHDACNNVGFEAHLGIQELTAAAVEPLELTVQKKSDTDCTFQQFVCLHGRKDPPSFPATLIIYRTVRGGAGVVAIPPYVVEAHEGDIGFIFINTITAHPTAVGLTSTRRYHGQQ